MSEKTNKLKGYIDSFNQILDHCRKCRRCREKMEELLSHAITVGDYKDE